MRPAPIMGADRAVAEEDGMTGTVASSKGAVLPKLCGSLAPCVSLLKYIYYVNNTSLADIMFIYIFARNKNHQDPNRILRRKYS